MRDRKIQSRSIHVRIRHLTNEIVDISEVRRATPDVFKFENPNDFVNIDFLRGCPSATSQADSTHRGRKITAPHVI